MFLYKEKRVAFDAKIEVDGVFYSVNNASDREAIGIIEVSDPVRPTPESDYYIQEIDEAPYLSVVKKSDEQIAEQEAAKRSQQRAVLFAAADILFMKEQRGEVEAGSWLAECKRIREEFPK